MTWALAGDESRRSSWSQGLPVRVTHMDCHLIGPRQMAARARVYTKEWPRTFKETRLHPRITDGKNFGNLHPSTMPEAWP
jgi:hypothetical protein